MKKLFLALVILVGGFTTEVINASAERPATCTPDTPCAYSGTVYRDNNSTSSAPKSLYIEVYIKNMDGRYVYVVDINNGESTAYAVDDDNERNKYHINYKGGVYHFKL